MTKKIKLCFLSLLAITFMLSAAAFFGVSAKKSFADTETQTVTTSSNVVIADEFWVRTENPEGLRVKATINNKADYTSYGIVFMPADKVVGELTKDSKNGAVEAVVANADVWIKNDGEDTNSFYGVLTAQNKANAFPSSFYNRPIAARAFAVKTDGSVEYSTATVKRSIGYIAALGALSNDNAVIAKIANGTTKEIKLEGVSGDSIDISAQDVTAKTYIGGMLATTSDKVNVAYSVDSDAISVADDGKITANKIGSATITATVTVENVTEKSITVTKALTVTANTQTVSETYFALKQTNDSGEIVSNDYTKTSLSGTSVTSITLGDANVDSTNYNFSDGTLTVKNAAFADYMGENKVLHIVTDKEIIDVTFGKVATFAITKASDVNSGNGSVPAWMKACGLTDDLKSDGNYMKYDGYVVVANDIDFKSAILNNKVMCHNVTGVWNVGFGGTFDGMGHSLKNFTVKGTNTSFFGNLNFGSVVKDVKFIDFTVDGYACFGLFDSQCYATIQNVTIECTYSNPYDSNGAKPKNAAALGNFSYYGEWKKGASLIDCDITVHAGEGFDGKDLSGVYGVMGEGSAFTSTAGSTIKTNFKVPASFTSGGGTVSQLITETKTESWFAQKQTNASGEIVNNNYTISGLTGGKVIKVLLNGEIVSESYYSYSGGTFTIQGAAFTCYGDNRTLSVFTDKDGVAVTFGKVASFAITKASDINSESGTFAPWASALGLNALNGVSYGGYVILTCNIDFDGAMINNSVPCTNGGDSSCFVGTFDGCGYTLKNFTVSGINTSFFGVIGSVGVIKNVNFTGFTVDGYACFGLFDSEFSGTIDNCTISGTYNNSKSGTSQLGSLLGTFNNSSKLTNCTITVTVGDGAEASDYGALKARNYGSTLATNVIITGTTITTDFALHDAFASAKQTTTEE